jgi:NAD(P)-dependent dehydrogenase (short-subunit alcohol dehydrogenase family)
MSSFEGKVAVITGAGSGIGRALARHSPEMAAKTIVDGVAKGHARVVVGWDAKAFDWLARITGSSYQRIVAAGVAKFFPWANNHRTKAFDIAH